MNIRFTIRLGLLAVLMCVALTSKSQLANCDQKDAANIKSSKTYFSTKTCEFTGV